MPARATLNGTITVTGGENCDQRGFDWGTQTGVYPYNWTESGSYGTGAFSHLISSLILNQTYYFRAKAHNSVGWGYGTEKSFVTPPPTVLKLHTSMVRMLVRPLPRAKLESGIIPIHMVRKSYFPFQIQTPVKGVVT
jgi:hypothetical protein